VAARDDVDDQSSRDLHALTADKPRLQHSILTSPYAAMAFYIVLRISDLTDSCSLLLQIIQDPLT